MTSYHFLLGGYYVHRQGGYTSEHALKICLILSWCAAIFACPFPFVKIYPVSVGMMWCLLFFGGSLMPTLTGIFAFFILIFFFFLIFF